MSTKVGNIFVLAEKQLLKEVDDGKRDRYNIMDVIDYASKIRKWLDKNQLVLTPKEKKNRRKAINRTYYLKRRAKC